MQQALQGLQQQTTSARIPFKTVDPQQWRIWRRNFEQIANIKGWNQQRQRREIASSMEADAALAVYDIAVDVPNDPQATGQALLNAYEARFVPAAAGQLARSEFKAAKQKPGETILAWHTRLRELFLRATPNGDANADQSLIDTFTHNLVDPAIMMYVLDQNPATYVMALQAAQNKQATLLVMGKQVSSGGLHVMGGAEVHAIRQGGKGPCWTCNAPDHQRHECPLEDKIRQRLVKEGWTKPDKGAGRGGGGGGRGRGGRGSRGKGQGQRGRGRGKRQVNAIDQEDEDDEDDDEAEDIFAGN